MNTREKLNEYAELQGWNKNKLIGWSEAADFGDWLVENLNTPDVKGNFHDLIKNHFTHKENGQERKITDDEIEELERMLYIMKKMDK